MAVASIINYCTNDYRFIGKCIEEARHFSDQILIPVCDHFFNEKPENRALLEHTYADHPDCQFIEYAYSSTKLYSPYLSYCSDSPEWRLLWYSTSRYIGFLHLKDEIDTVFFLDCDEIAEGKRMAQWLETEEHKKWSGALFLAYYYALRTDLRAKKLQPVPLMVRRSALEPRFVLHPKDRGGPYSHVEGSKNGEMRGADLKPLFHHYSWVRPEHECLQKADTTGHHLEADWTELVRRTFSGEVKLFGTQQEFEKVQDVYFDPFSVPIPDKPLIPRSYPNVKKVNHRDIFKMELELAYGDCNRH